MSTTVNKRTLFTYVCQRCEKTRVTFFEEIAASEKCKKCIREESFLKDQQTLFDFTSEE